MGIGGTYKTLELLNKTMLCRQLDIRLFFSISMYVVAIGSSNLHHRSRGKVRAKCLLASVRTLFTRCSVSCCF